MTRSRLFLAELAVTVTLAALLALGLRPALVALPPGQWLAVVLTIASLLALAVVVTGEHVYASRLEGGAR